MSAQVTITQLPTAGAITGTELVPIVQNGQTVQTTTAAIAGSPSQTQTFLTKNQEPTLPNSRALAGGTGVGLIDNGAQSTLQVYLNGVSATLETASNGIIAKSGGAVVARTLSTSGAGLTVADGSGVSANPTFSLTGVAASVAGLSGTGVLALTSSGTAVSGRQLTGTTNQIVVANGTGASGNPTFAIADNAVFSGIEGVTIPAGTTGQRPISPNNGEIRYNTSSSRIEAYIGGAWVTMGSGDGSVTSVSGTSGQITVANGTTTPQISITTNPVMPGTASISIPAGSTAARPGSPTNGMIRYNTSTALFEGYLNGAWSDFSSGSVGVTSIATGTGLTGGPITSTGTISIDSTVVTLTGTQTLTAKTLTSPVINTPNLTGGTINNASIGATTPSTGAFTSVSMTTGTITTAPTSGTDIVNKDYADSIAAGLNYHQPVNYASTTTLPAYTYNNGTSGVGATITATANGALSLGGGSPTATQRVLIKNETGGNAAYNGIYVVTQVGSLLLPFILTRATDYDTSGSGTNEIDQGDYVLVISGTLASTAWVQQTPLPITVGTTALTFVQFNAPITYSAGTGLNESPAFTFNIANTAVTSGSYGGAATVPTFSVNAQGQLTSASNTTIAIAGSQITSGAVAIANGGTGQTTASAAFNALSPITTTGDLIIGNGTNSATRLPIGANTYILKSNGSTASWAANTAATVDDVIALSIALG